MYIEKIEGSSGFLFSALLTTYNTMNIKKYDFILLILFLSDIELYVIALNGVIDSFGLLHQSDGIVIKLCDPLVFFFDLQRLFLLPRPGAL